MRKRHARLPSTGSYIAITAVSWTSGLDQDFLPAIASTSGRIHCKLRLLFLHAHRETTCFFTTGTRNHTHLGFFNTLKSKTGLMVARAAALRANINIDGRPRPTVT